MHSFNPQDLERREIYKLLIGSIVPRPIAFVATTGSNGDNLAPFSFYNCFSVSPPIIGFTCLIKDSGNKDTLENILETEEFVVNVVSEEFIEKVNVAAIPFSPKVNEFQEAGLKTAQSLIISTPSVEESKIRLECKLHKIFEIGDEPASLILGEVVNFAIDSSVYMSDYRINTDTLKPVGRMAGNNYTTCRSDISLGRKS